MFKTTIKALLCVGVTFGASVASANDQNASNIEAFELSNIQFLAARVGANGYRFDFRERRDEVKGIIEDRIAMVTERRNEIKLAISSGSLSTSDKVALWKEFAELRTRLGRLYADRRGVLTWGIMDLEELEEFYAPTVSVS